MIMSEEIARPFDSLDSALEYMTLLGESIDEAMAEVQRDLATARGHEELRTVQALELAQFKMKQLSTYVQRSQRALNDLRTLRRLLLEER